MPVYLVKVPGNPPSEKLVEASNSASARNHVGRQVITATLAKQADLFRVAKAGGDIETAGQDPQEGGGMAELEELATTQTDETRQDPPAEEPAKGGKVK